MLLWLFGDNRGELENALSEVGRLSGDLEIARSRIEVLERALIEINHRSHDALYGTSFAEINSLEIGQEREDVAEHHGARAQ